MTEQQEPINQEKITEESKQHNLPSAESSALKKLHTEAEYNDNDNAHGDEKNKWNTCGFILDKNCLSFAITTIFSFTLIIFCITQLASRELPNDKFTLYVSLLCGIINTWIPSPLFK